MSRPQANWHTRHKEQLTAGERAADWMRNGMGSWVFIGIFVSFMIVWAIINSKKETAEMKEVDAELGGGKT